MVSRRRIQFLNVDTARNYGRDDIRTWLCISDASRSETADSNNGPWFCATRRISRGNLPRPAFPNVTCLNCTDARSSPDAIAFYIFANFSLATWLVYPGYREVSTDSDSESGLRVSPVNRSVLGVNPDLSLGGGGGLIHSFCWEF